MDGGQELADIRLSNTDVLRARNLKPAEWRQVTMAVSGVVRQLGLPGKQMVTFADKLADIGYNGKEIVDFFQSLRMQTIREK